MSSQTVYQATPQPAPVRGDRHPTDTFGDRLRLLVGDQSTSAFARQVGLSESLVRKYIKGSEPSLSKAWQIAYHTQTSLYWLAGAPEPEPGTNRDGSTTD